MYTYYNAIIIIIVTIIGIVASIMILVYILDHRTLP